MGTPEENARESEHGVTSGASSPSADQERILLLECRLEQLRSQLEEERANADRVRRSLAEASAREADHARRLSLVRQELAEARSEIASLYERLGRSEAMRAELEGHLFEAGAESDAAELVRLRREVLAQRERCANSERALARTRARVDDVLLSRDALLTRVAEWQRLVQREGSDAVDLGEFIAELRRDILHLEQRSSEGERQEAALRERLARAGLDPDSSAEEEPEPADEEPAPLPEDPHPLPEHEGEVRLEEDPYGLGEDADLDHDSTRVEGTTEAAPEEPVSAAAGSPHGGAQEGAPSLSLPSPSAGGAPASAEGEEPVAAETGQPSSETGEPPTEAAEPSSEREESSTESGEFAAETEQPAADGEPPSPADNEQPAAQSENPATETEQPAAGSEGPAAGSADEPSPGAGVSGEDLGGGREQPSAEIEQPPAQAEQPLEETQQPIAEDGQPAAEEPPPPGEGGEASLEEARTAAERERPAGSASAIEEGHNGATATPDDEPALTEPEEGEREPSGTAPLEEVAPEGALAEEGASGGAERSEEEEVQGEEAGTEEPTAAARSEEEPSADHADDALDTSDPAVRAVAYEQRIRRLQGDPERLRIQLESALSDPDARVRRRAALAASTVRSLPLHSLLEPLREDPDPQVRRVVREVLRHAPAGRSPEDFRKAAASSAERTPSRNPR